MAKKKNHLPGNFSRIMERGDFEEIKAVFHDKEMVKDLIETEESPFFYYSPCTEIYKWFVEQGFDIHLEKWCGQPIHYHAQAAKNNIEGIILAGGDIEQTSKGDTPLLWAAEAPNPSSLSVLIRYGANVHAKTGNIVFRNVGALELIFKRWKRNNAVRAVECMELLVNAGITMEDWMRDEVIDLCKDYERSKDSTYTNDLQPYEEAMTRMCKLFDVERPIPNIHDGTALITVTATDWRDQHEELWNMLVPGVGKCKTVQGEVIRIGGRINDEIFSNGGRNWDREYRKMLNALKKYYVMGEVPDEEEHQEALALIKSIGRNSDGEDVLRLCKINVHWVLANPKPIMLGDVNYSR